MGELIVKIQAGKDRQAAYGDKVLTQLSKDLNQKYGKGFSDRNLRYMRKFFQTYRMNQIHSELSWSHYRCLLLIEDSRLRLELEKKAIKEALTQRDLLSLLSIFAPQSKAHSSLPRVARIELNRH